MDIGGKVTLPLVLSTGPFVLCEMACAIISLLIVTIFKLLLGTLTKERKNTKKYKKPEKTPQKYI